MSSSTGAYGGASLVIPMCLMALYPPFLVLALAAGLLIVCVVALVTTFSRR